jgi:hypothetical protein
MNGKSNSLRLANRTAASDPTTERHFPSVGLPNFHAELFPHDSKGLPTLATDHCPHRRHVHHNSTISPLSTRKTMATLVQKGGKKKKSSTKNWPHCLFPAPCTASRLARCPVPFSLAARPWSPNHNHLPSWHDTSTFPPSLPTLTTRFPFRAHQAHQSHPGLPVRFPMDPGPVRGRSAATRPGGVFGRTARVLAMVLCRRGRLGRRRASNAPAQQMLI